MREIRFRFWDTKSNVLYPSMTLKEISQKVEVNDSLIPMQFIEKKDIKGSDAYDGDIVKYKCISCGGISYGTAFIKYVDGIPKLQVIDCLVFKSGSIIYMVDDFQIIGNIYEKPEF